MRGHPEGPFKRRQKARKGDQPTGRRPLAQAVCARRQHDHAQRPLALRSRNEVAARHSGQAADEARRAGASGENRAHRLGDPGLGRSL